MKERAGLCAAFFDVNNEVYRTTPLIIVAHFT